MRQSQLFTKTRKEVPADEVAKNASLLIRGGYIHKEMAGVYSYLPLGLLTLNNVVEIIRKEMNDLGGQEVYLPALQDSAVWAKTDRWQSAESVWFKTKLRSGAELGLGFTHEEPLTAMVTDYIRSFRDLPVYVYQFQTKFRNEARAKSGIIRGREFLMKDLYSFSRDEKEHAVFYEKVKDAYRRIFNKVGLGPLTHVTFASGGSFSKYSHEFQTETDAGEDTIHVCDKCSVAVNEEIFAELKKCPDCGGESFTIKRAVEVGNIFNLGTRFSDALNLGYLDENGAKRPVVMGSYGIGPGRLMGTIVEVLSDEKGIVWPQAVAPFSVHLVDLSNGDRAVAEAAKKIYENFSAKNIKVLWDEREARAGEKFADADLIGVPFRAVVSEKTVSAKVIEIKRRQGGETEMVPEDQIFSYLNAET